MMLADSGSLEPISLSLLRTLRTVLPLASLVTPALASLPVFAPLRRVTRSVISDLVPLKTQVPPEPPTRAELDEARSRSIKVWRQMILALLAMVELGVWMGVTGSEFLRALSGEVRATDVVLAAGMVLVWLYLLARPLLRPPNTPPWPTTLVYALLWTLSVVHLCVAFYVRASLGRFPPWATPVWFTLETGNIVVTSILLLVIGGLPLASPYVLVRLPTIAPDDLVTLSSWLTFTWVNPFISLGSSKELEPEDLPSLSLTMQTAIVFDRFRQIAGSTLLRRILLANRLDLALDAGLTLISVVFNYAGPFFLQRILDGLTDRSPEAMSRAYVYAVMAFLASVFKALSDLLHLWHGRRAAVRIKAELIAAVYDKALKRKDASGVITKEEEKEEQAPDGKSKDKAAGHKDKAGGKKDDKAKAKPEEKKTNADSGKVVNLMSGDTNRISNTVSGAYYIYGSPFEIIVASIFLYNILGWSAFAGIVVLAVAVPLNSFLSKRSVKITQELLKARDKRISVMNELIPAIQFIKASHTRPGVAFFAWSEQWKQRAKEARAGEMSQMIRSLINGLWFSMLWNLVPISVTLISFFCYIVIAQRELTVSVAFTAISLFNMLQMPLNVIPTFIVIILQAHVSVKRIEDFLNEDEVPDWVSSLKRNEGTSTGKAKIGFENASFRWNSGKQSEAKSNSNGTSAPNADAEPSSSTSSGDITATETAEAYFRLSDLNVDFPIGKLTVITGPTGSGKTAILTALLGEMELLEGKSHLPKHTTMVNDQGLRNSVAYAAQTPWLQQKSIKDNILFGEEYDEARYEATIEACALVPDFDMLEDGDATEIGQKGISLSGGQKARVALARAVYSFTQHILLDDPLAAVDSHTAKHLTDKCLNGPILKGRTVILVSHHLELLLPSAHYIVRLLDGRVDAQGRPAELRQSGELDGLVALEEAEVKHEEAITANEAVDGEAEAVDGEAEGDGDKKKAKKERGPAKKFVQDEERPVGNVKWQTYKLYIKAATYVTWGCSAIVLVSTQIATNGERYWLKIWGEAYLTSFQPLVAFARPLLNLHSTDYHHVDLHQQFMHHVPANMTQMALSQADATLNAFTFPKLPSAHTHPGFYLSIYAAIVIGEAVLSVFSSAIGNWGQYRAAVNIHDRLLDTVMRGTIRFFNVTPTGRIINRFSRDIETIDSSLNSGLRTVIVYIASLLAAVAVVTAIVPWFLVPAALISYAYYRYSVLYLRVGRSLRRLEATLRSPIYSGFAELLDGVISVRAFSVEKRFMNLLCEQVDKTHSAFYYYWLLVRFDVLGAFSVAFTTLLALGGAVKPGSAGMAILSAQSFVSACYWVSRFWGQLEMDFNAVERVQEYLLIPQEPPAIIPDRRPPAYWPSADPDHKQGFLSVRDLEIKYAPDLPTVFQGSFEVDAGEKIGLIGRTGSGKSTLAMSLLRFADPDKGKIVLDGIDITSIGVDDLRSRITYIPQDAVLFSGTVRTNLDPFDEHSDEELLDALSRVNLGPSETPQPSRAPSRVPSSRRLAAVAAEDAASGMDTPSTAASTTGGGKVTITLATEVSAGGSNFSQGQRQLIAMARALLRRSNLIVMDEATASVDFATDEAIQQAIRTEFKSSTLLTIAHRLSSVIDYDRLLVLSDGHVVEFDTPINLLRRDDSFFKSLCEKSGRYRELYRAAERKEQADTDADADADMDEIKAKA